MTLLLACCDLHILSVFTGHCAGDAPKALFHKVPLPHNIITPNVSAQSSFDDSLPPRSRSASPAKTKGQTALLIGLSTGLFDANNPKVCLVSVINFFLPVVLLWKSSVIGSLHPLSTELTAYCLSFL